MHQIDTDVIVVGAGPTGLTLAHELGARGVRTLVLERLTEVRDVPKAGGIGGRTIDYLRYRGLLERFEAASGKPRPTPNLPFGGLHVDLGELVPPPMEVLLLPQPDLERLLAELAAEVGCEIRRGREVLAVRQSESAVEAEVRGPDGAHRVSGRYLVGCDGVGSPIRGMAGIEFPGTSYPEVERLTSFTRTQAVKVLDDGSLEVPGLGRLPFGYTHTDRGVFAMSVTSDRLGLYTSEEEDRTYDDDEPMTVAEFQASVRRVLGADIPIGAPLRLTRFTYGARHVDRYRTGRIFLAGDAAHQFPSGGVGLNAGMLDSVNLAWKLAAELAGWAPAGLLDSYHDERHLAGERTLLHTQAQLALRRGLDQAAHALRQIVAELLEDAPARRRIGTMIAGADIRYPMPGERPHALAGTFVPDLVSSTNRGSGGSALAGHARGTRPVLVDLADRPDLRAVARGWRGRVDVRTAATDDRPADALLIRPDGYVAWAAAVDQAADESATELERALTTWFGVRRTVCET